MPPLTHRAHSLQVNSTASLVSGSTKDKFRGSEHLTAPNTQLVNDGGAFKSWDPWNTAHTACPDPGQAAFQRANAVLLQRRTPTQPQVPAPDSQPPPGPWLPPSPWSPYPIPGPQQPARKPTCPHCPVATTRKDHALPEWLSNRKSVTPFLPVKSVSVGTKQLLRQSDAISLGRRADTKPHRPAAPSSDLPPGTG